jgi:hypothetical protein
VLDALARHALPAPRERVQSSAAGRWQYELSDDEIRGQLRFALSHPLDPHLDHHGGAADVEWRA